jgi:hypothetical protein
VATGAASTTASTTTSTTSTMMMMVMMMMMRMMGITMFVAHPRTGTTLDHSQTKDNAEDSPPGYSYIAALPNRVLHTLEASSP